MKLFQTFLRYLIEILTYIGCVVISGGGTVKFASWLITPDKMNDPQHAFAILIFYVTSFLILMIITCCSSRAFWKFMWREIPNET